MKKLIFVSLIVVALLSCNTNSNNNIALIKESEGDSLKLVQQDSLITAKVELIEKTDTINDKAGCGYRCIITTWHFKVIKIENGHYNLKTIPILILCPGDKLQNKGIENNKTYTYHLKRAQVGQRVYCDIAVHNVVYYITDNLKL